MCSGSQPRRCTPAPRLGSAMHIASSARSRASRGVSGRAARRGAVRPRPSCRRRPSHRRHRLQVLGGFAFRTASLTRLGVGVQPVRHLAHQLVAAHASRPSPAAPAPPRPAPAPARSAIPRSARSERGPHPERSAGRSPRPPARGTARPRPRRACRRDPRPRASPPHAGRASASPATLCARIIASAPALSASSASTTVSPASPASVFSCSGVIAVPMIATASSTPAWCSAITSV